MKDFPIIFSTPMVRAILDGRKTMTRRVITARNSLRDGDIPGRAHPWDQHDFVHAWVDPGPSPAGNPGPYLHVPFPPEETVHRIYPRFWKGDRLWVRETWKRKKVVGTDAPFVYKADPGMAGMRWDDLGTDWRPSIHMPRAASRITLEITKVRPELLQAISRDDAVAEGIIADNPRAAFRALWDSLNADRGFDWIVNPWIWAITFTVMKGWSCRPLET